MRKTIVVLIGLVLLLNGCAIVPIYKEGLIANGQLQKDHAKSIAKFSTSIFDYVSQIYAAQPLDKQSDYITAYKDIAESLQYNYWSTDFFKIYCDEKGGELFQWIVERKEGYMFSMVRGVSNNLITCEKSNKIDSALLYESYVRDSQIYPYEIYTKYANESYIKKFFDDNKLSGFTSNNGIITFPITRIYDSKFGYASENYSVFFYYKNDTDKPQEINILNSYVMIGGSKYSIDFTYFDEPIRWPFYYIGEGSGVFVGPKGKKLTKLMFNPGQMLYGEFFFKIPGLTKITEEDMESFMFQMDNIKCEKFKRMSYYEKLKKKFNKQ